uniref:Uncharacterized protein n=1 Tax=Arundo donax TaxID=35708 RepID=A0A0A9D9F0_ARUDO
MNLCKIFRGCHTLWNMFFLKHAGKLHVIVEHADTSFYDWHLFGTQKEFVSMRRLLNIVTNKLLSIWTHLLSCSGSKLKTAHFGVAIMFIWQHPACCL